MTQRRAPCRVSRRAPPRQLARPGRALRHFALTLLNSGSRYEGDIDLGVMGGVYYAGALHPSRAGVTWRFARASMNPRERFTEVAP